MCNKKITPFTALMANLSDILDKYLYQNKNTKFLAKGVKIFSNESFVLWTLIETQVNGGRLRNNWRIKIIC